MPDAITLDVMMPEMDGWESGLGPWTPVIKEDRLFGRGGADDGYALFASLAL